MRILLICGQSTDASQFKNGLQNMGYAVDIAQSPNDALQLAETGDYDAILAQEGTSSYLDSVKLTRRMRNADVGDPILLVPSDVDEETVTQAFDAGADQVMDPDHSFNELIARVRGLLRQCVPTPGDKLSYRDIEIDLSAMRATREGKPLGLIGKPFAMLELFVRRPEKVLTREEIGESVWDRNFDPFSNVIDVTVSKVRQQLDKPFDVPYLHTVVGSGYMLHHTPPGHTEWG
ncbi:MAG: response regulator transcription factor [Planctomycetota bacterium]